MWSRWRKNRVPTTDDGHRFAALAINSTSRRPLGQRHHFARTTLQRPVHTFRHSLLTLTECSGGAPPAGLQAPTAGAVEGFLMNAQWWRALALVAAALTLAYVVGSIVNLTGGGDYGITFTPYGLRGTIAQVEPGSQAARTGIAVGDRITLRDRSLRNRIAFLVQPAPGDRLNVVVEHGAMRRVVTLVAARIALPAGTSALYFSGVVYQLIRVVLVALATLIAIRRPARSDARAIASFFIAFAFADWPGWRWYPVAAAFALDILRSLALLFSFEQLVLFAARFPQPSAAGARRWIERLASPLFALWALAFCADEVLTALGATPISGFAETIFSAVVLLDLIFIGAAFTLAGREGTAEDRQRLRWVALSLGIGVCGFVLAIAIFERDPDSWWSLMFFMTLAIPIGPTYAILRHRMLDIGFVINRALVFATLSAIVVIAFTALELIIGKVLVSAGHVTSIVLELTLALAIGLSFKGLHARADHFVDNVFFRERHLAELALRRLAQEVAFITNAQTLAQRTVAAVDRHAGAAGSSIYLFTDEGTYVVRLTTIAAVSARVDENDPAVVAMRTFREHVDLENLLDGASALHGELAFPMLVRGESVGILVCGAKRNGERYAPDEIETLAALAHAVGIAFETISTKTLRTAVDRTLRGEATLDELRDARTSIPLG